MQIILWYAQYYEAVLLCHFNQTAHSKFRWNYLLDIHIRNENKNIHTHHMGRPTKFTYHRFVHWQFFFFVFHFSFFSIILFKLKTMYALSCIWLCAGTDDNWQESIVDRPQFPTIVVVFGSAVVAVHVQLCQRVFSHYWFNDRTNQLKFGHLHRHNHESSWNECLSAHNRNRMKASYGC